MDPGFFVATAGKQQDYDGYEIDIILHGFLGSGKDNKHLLRLLFYLTT
jgi:hypothetical protein